MEKIEEDYSFWEGYPAYPHTSCGIATGFGGNHKDCDGCNTHTDTFTFDICFSTGLGGVTGCRNPTIEIDEAGGQTTKQD